VNCLDFVKSTWIFIMAESRGDPLASTIRSFDPQDDPANTGACWERWLRIFETFVVAKQITDDAVKAAQLAKGRTKGI
jgi:hypothetical protein